ncbi:MAG: response regulator [Burkholderiaceae bacterium]
MIQAPEGFQAPGPPLRHAVDPPLAVDAQVARERLRALYDRTPQALVGAYVFGALLAWAVSPGSGVLVAWGWYAVRAVLLAVRLTDWWRFTRADHPPPDHGRLTRRYDVLVTLDGVSWGVVAVLFHQHDSPLLDGALLASLVGVAAVGVFTLNTHLGMAMRFMGATLVPAFLHHLTHGSLVSVLIAGGLAVLFVVVFLEARANERRMLELLRLRFENAAIAEQRQRALNLARHSSATKSRFLATVSHELRTPLNGILGMTQLMSLDPLPPGQAERVEVVQQSARHLLSLIGDLLDVSRIEYGRTELHAEPVALVASLAEVIELLRPMAQAKRLALRIGLLQDVPPLAHCDPVRVKQVLHNLIGNAIKFTAHGEVRVDAVRDGERLVFSVHDTGEGIAPDQLERIFDAFEQAPLHTGTRRAGTGLGLTISRHLARAMGGDVVCRSLPGEGAVFEFSMACVPVAVPTPEAGAPAPDMAMPRPGARVLVVEDNPVNALVITAMIERLGLRQEAADDGEQALEWLQRERFDAVLMDCQLPVIDGYEATRQWRECERAALSGPRLPIIALTAHASEADREQCLAAGMDGYLAKPVTLEALAAALASHLPNGGTTGSA